MNFRYMPELEWTWGYPVTLAAIVGICGYLYYRFHRAGWI
jgi:magnesium transporter